MPNCGNCGMESARIRTIFQGDGSRDECKFCAPESFEKHSDPSTRKIWTGPEFAPNDYEYVAGNLQLKPEAQSELERKACGDLSVAYQQEQAAIAEAEAKKRATRRTKALSQAELETALSFCNRTLRPIIEDQETAYEI